MQIPFILQDINNPVDIITYWKQISADIDNLKRKNLSREVDDYYNFEQYKYLEEAISEQFSDKNVLKGRRKFPINYVRGIAQARAQAYECEPKREILKDLSDEKKQLLSKQIWSNQNSFMFNTINNYSFKKHYCYFKAGRIKVKRLKALYINNTHLMLYYRRAHQEKELLGAFISDYQSVDKRCTFYTKDAIYTIIDNEIVDINQHNLNLLPFILVYSEDPGLEDYLLPDHQIVRGNLELNLAHSNLLSILQAQSHAIPVFTGIYADEVVGEDENNTETAKRSQEVDKRLDPGPNKSLMLGPNADFKLVTSNVDLNSQVAAINFEASQYGRQYDVEIVVEVNASAPATTFVLKENKKDSLLRNDRLLMAQIEKELFIKSLEILSSVGYKYNISVDDISINFIEESPIAENITAADIKVYSELGAMSPIDIIMKLYPKMSVSDAEKKYQIMEAWKKENTEEKGGTNFPLKETEQ